MGILADNLQKYLDTTPREQVLKDWEETKEFDQVDSPLVEDFLEQVQAYQNMKAQEAIKALYMQRPCIDCPLTKGCRKGWLGKARAKEIANQSSFVCHKHLSKGMEGRKQCAGHMLLKEDGNDFVKLAKELKVALNLSGRELVFDSVKAFVSHHGK